MLFFSLFLKLPAQSSRYTNDDCLLCHGKPEISQVTSIGEVRSVYVNPEDWAQDVHNKKGIVCVDCHANANPYLHFREGFIRGDCARCHPEEEEEYQKNIHLTFSLPSANKELPLCYHCHTKHSVLRYDDPSSSIHEKNIGKTCGSCHPEVMVRAITKGTSLGKISGHRKGDLSEKFDMRVCISCHYEDSAHGQKRAYKDFCSRCHDVRSKGTFILGPIHLDSMRWVELNYLGSGLVLFLLVGTCFILGYRSRKGIRSRIKAFLESLKSKEGKAPEKEDSGQAATGG